MKAIMTGISLIILSLVLTNIAGAEIAPETIAGSWLFDEGKGDIAKDSSGNGNDGKLIDGPKWTDGKFGKALEFKANARVEIPHTDSLDIRKKMTVTAWIKTTHAGLQTIVGKDNDSGADRSWHFATTSEGVPGGLRFTTFPGHITLLGKTPANTDKWLFVAATFDGKETKVYLNGVVDGTGVKAGDLTSIKEPVKIGVMDETNGAKWFFTGLIDEVAIFTTVLIEDDLKTIMNQGLESVMAVSPAGKLATRWATIKAAQY